MVFRVAEIIMDQEDRVWLQAKPKSGKRFRAQVWWDSQSKSPRTLLQLLNVPQHNPTAQLLDLGEIRVYADFVKDVAEVADCFCWYGGKCETTWAAAFAECDFE